VGISRPTDRVACQAAEILFLDHNMRVVSSRVHVVPAGEDRVAIRAVSFGRDGTEVTNEFVLKLSGEIEEVPDTLRPEIDKAIAAPWRCKVHGQSLKLGLTLMHPETSMPRGYHEAEKSLFPFAHSSSRYPSPKTNAHVAGAKSWFCSECRAVEKAWLEEHREPRE